MTRGTEFKNGEETGGNDSDEWDRKGDAKEKKDGHYSNGGGHEERGDANKKDPKRN